MCTPWNLHLVLHQGKIFHELMSMLILILKDRYLITSYHGATSPRRGLLSAVPDHCWNNRPLSQSFVQNTQSSCWAAGWQHERNDANKVSCRPKTAARLMKREQRPDLSQAGSSQSRTSSRRETSGESNTRRVSSRAINVMLNCLVAQGTKQLS